MSRTAEGLLACVMVPSMLTGCAALEDGPCPLTEGICAEGLVTHVVDGDTLDLEDGLRIRLALVDAPELDEAGGPEARDFLTDLCLGTSALVDEDDFQIGGDPYGRVLALVYCDGVNANAEMISEGGATTYLEFCSESEFAESAWSRC